ncbi:MAG: DNA-directed RNA polymerase subunit A', partial [Promethearchaeota archaeon]
MSVSKAIGRISFGLLSPDNIRKMSVTRIITADTYDEDGLPIDSGLMDGRLGTIEPGRRCKTCGNRVGECPGHFGHIELARPVLHVGFAKFIRKLLRSTCRECGRLLIPEKDYATAEKQMKKYFDETDEINDDLASSIIKRAQKASACPYCEEEQYKIKLDKPTTYYEEGETGSNRLTPRDVRLRLERITNTDAFLLGINTKVARPEWTILTVLPVPPSCVRPSITLESRVRSEDDL